MNRFLIYALIDPRTDAVRYIGKSSRGMVRPNSHAAPSNLAKEKTHKANWLRSLQRVSLRPVVRILEVLGDEPTLNDAECFWIAQGRGLGWPLTNLTKGGDGASGHSLSAESRAKISAKNRGRVLGPEARARIGAASKARTTPEVLAILARADPAVRARVGAKLRGRKRPASALVGLRKNWKGRTVSDETRAKMRAAKLGKKQSPELIAKRVAAATGARRSAETRERMRRAQVARRQREREMEAVCSPT